MPKKSKDEMEWKAAILELCFVILPNETVELFKNPAVKSFFKTWDEITVDLSKCLKGELLWSLFSDLYRVYAQGGTINDLRQMAGI